MYADYDSSGKVSIMELNPEEVYVLTEALVRYATNPDIMSENRTLAKKIAYTIPNINLKTTEYGNEIQYE
jgi:hypothetical protein